MLNLIMGSYPEYRGKLTVGGKEISHVQPDSIIGSILNIQGLTRLVVTHRLDEKTLNRFDGIIVMKNGRVTEQGSFQELMEKKQYFYSLYMVSREA